MPFIVAVLGDIDMCTEFITCGSGQDMFGNPCENKIALPEPEADVLAVNKTCAGGVDCIVNSLSWIVFTLYPPQK